MLQPAIQLEVSVKIPLPQHIAAGIDAFQAEFGCKPTQVWLPYDVYQRATWEFLRMMPLRAVAPIWGPPTALSDMDPKPPTPLVEGWTKELTEPPTIETINSLTVVVYVPTAKYDQEVLIL
jgi:hypothetical protein